MMRWFGVVIAGGLLGACKGGGAKIEDGTAPVDDVGSDTTTGEDAELMVLPYLMVAETFFPRRFRKLYSNSSNGRQSAMDRRT